MLVHLVPVWHKVTIALTFRLVSSSPMVRPIVPRPTRTPPCRQPDAVMVKQGNATAYGSNVAISPVCSTTAQIVRCMPSTSCRDRCAITGKFIDTDGQRQLRMSRCMPNRVQLVDRLCDLRLVARRAIAANRRCPLQRNPHVCRQRVDGARSLPAEAFETRLTPCRLTPRLWCSKSL